MKPSSLPAVGRFFVSLRLTIVCLCFAMILVVCGTLAQVDVGIHAAQHKYFQSFLVFWTPPGTAFKLPILPGGYTIGTALLLNLVFAHVYRFKLVWKRAGINLIHFGIILLLLSVLLTDFFAVETQIRLDEGQTKNYSESLQETELAIIDLSHPDYDKVVAIPEKLLASEGTFQHPDLPFLVKVKRFMLNSNLGPRSGGEDKSGVTTGVGKNVEATELPPVTKEDVRNITTCFVELASTDGSLGTWMVSNGLGAHQHFSYSDRQFAIELRQRRFYKPFSLGLVKFTHEKYTGTDIPRVFSSLLHLKYPEKKEDRNVLIYMNHPLRYEGEAFYQASFDNDDKTTILQVVKNPNWLLPYTSCSLVALGLILQFSTHLLRFSSRRMA